MKINLVNEINDMLKYGFIPPTLDYFVVPIGTYGPDVKFSIDWNKLIYTHNTFDDVCKKFPNGWQSIPGFDLVIQDIADNSLSPLEDMIERFKLD